MRIFLILCLLSTLVLAQNAEDWDADGLRIGQAVSTVSWAPDNVKKSDISNISSLQYPGHPGFEYVHGKITKIWPTQVRLRGGQLVREGDPAQRITQVFGPAEKVEKFNAGGGEQYVYGQRSLLIAVHDDRVTDIQVQFVVKKKNR